MIDYQSTFTNTDGSAFPDTEAVNVSAPGAGDGTEFVAALVNDIWGRAQALLDYAGLTPDGVQEAPGTAQVIEAICKGFGVGPGIGGMYWKNGTPAANGDRVLLLQGQVITISSYPLLAAAVYCGDANNATAPAFYKTSDAGGTTRSTAGTYLVLPDTRGLSLKGVGNATISGRTKTGPAALGGVQEDQFQGHLMGRAGGGYAARLRDASAAGAGVDNFVRDAPGSVITNEITIVDNNVDGTPRTGANTRDSSIGTNFCIGY